MVKKLRPLMLGKNQSILAQEVPECFNYWNIFLFLNHNLLNFPNSFLFHWWKFSFHWSVINMLSQILIKKLINFSFSLFLFISIRHVKYVLEIEIWLLKNKPNKREISTRWRLRENDEKSEICTCAFFHHWIT